MPRISKVLSAMDQRPEKIFQHAMMNTPRSLEMLPVCSNVRDVIKASLSKTASVYLLGLRYLEMCVNTGTLTPLTRDYKRILDQIYPGKGVSSYFLGEWVKSLKCAHDGSQRADIDVLIRALGHPWMCLVC